MTIDFLQLMKEERRKARSKKKATPKEDQAEDADAPAIAASVPNKYDDHDGATNASSTTLHQSHGPAISVNIQRNVPMWKPKGSSSSLLQLERLIAPARTTAAAAAATAAAPTAATTTTATTTATAGNTTPPNTIRYFPQVISDDDEQHLSAWLDELESSDDGVQSWKTMKYGKRRVALFSATPDLPQPLQAIVDGLVQAGLYAAEQAPNHVLINAYAPGQGIMPHTDGPSYVACTSTLSLGSSVLLNFTKARSSTNDVNEAVRITSSADSREGPTQVLLQPRSLIVFSEDAYSDYCHGITPDIMRETSTASCINAPEGTIVDRGHRYSLTFRHKFDNTTML